MSSNNPAQKVLLQTFEDWGRWDEEFQTKAMGLHLWDCVNPESDMLMMERPEKPDISAFYRRIPARMSDQEPQAQSGRQTRYSGQSTQTIRQSSPEEPVFLIPETTDHHHRARNISELTADDKASYTFEWKMYEQNYKEYKEQENNCERLKAWVTDTVDYGLRQSSCRPMWDLRTWYSNLKASVGATDREQQATARRKYQTAITTLNKVPKDFASWITTWEMAANHALVRQTGGMEDPNVWFEDLTKAVQPILGSWIAIYTGIYKEKLEEKTLTIGEVAKDLRKEADQRNILSTREKAPRATRGAFGPTFAGEPASAPTHGVEPEEQGTTSQKRQGSGSSSGQKRKATQSGPARRKKAATVNESEQMCKACDGNHSLANCYYVFPDNAPEYFKERKVIRDAVEHRLRTNQSLKDEINQIKKDAQFEESA